MVRIHLWGSSEMNKPLFSRYRIQNSKRVCYLSVTDILQQYRNFTSARKRNFFVIEQIWVGAHFTTRPIRTTFYYGVVKRGVWPRPRNIYQRAGSSDATPVYNAGTLTLAQHCTDVVPIPGVYWGQINGGWFSEGACDRQLTKSTDLLHDKTRAKWRLKTLIARGRVLRLHEIQEFGTKRSLNYERLVETFHVLVKNGECTTPMVFSN